MKDNLKVTTAQFQPRSGDKKYNLGVMENLIKMASVEGTQVISFHELCTTGYTFLKDLDKESLFELAESIPDGETFEEMVRLAQKYRIVILAGILERENGKVFNSYVCLDENGLIAKHRKLHPFISSFLSAGNQYTVFEIGDWKCGILICYDNNIIENVRATSLLGAEIIFAPHVTGCTPSSMPGRGFVDGTLWTNRLQDPVALRQEFDGPKGKGWLMRWLPARAYDNGVYYVFSNPIGYDGEQLKNGNAMIFDPYGEVLAEVRSFENTITTAILTDEKLEKAGGYRYRNARRPEMYKDILASDHRSKTQPYWLDKK